MRGPAWPPSMPGMERPPIALGRHRPPASRGFTAIELMVVVAILAILAALAAPSFTPLIERWRVRQATEGLESTLYYARSEAIKRGGNVAIGKLDNTNGCTTAGGSNDWGCGWIVCEDTDGSGSCNASEPVLQRFDAPARLEITRGSGGANIALNRWGVITGTWVGFTVIPQGKNLSDPAAKGVCVSSGGRVRIEASPPCTSG